MEAKSAAKVGIVVVLAFVVFGALYSYLTHRSPNAYTVTLILQDSRGLSPRSVVRMLGVSVGEVKDVRLDLRSRPPQPVARLIIEKQFLIPQKSRFIVASGILINTPQVQIIPSAESAYLPQDGTARVEGEKPQSALAALSPDAQHAIEQFSSTFETLNTRFGQAYKKIDRLLDQTNTVMENVNKTVVSTNAIVSQPEVRESLTETMDNFRKVARNANQASEQLTADLHEILNGSKQKIDRLTDRLFDTVNSINSTIVEANTVVKRLTEQVADPRFQQSLQETAELARTTLARFNQLASDLHQFIGDPALQSDLKQAIANLRETTEQTQQVAEKVNDALGKLVGSTGKVRPRLPRVEMVTTVSQQINPGRLRIDLDARAAVGSRSLFDLGIYDVGQTARLNLQAGSRLSDSLTARYGLYASRLGVGLDWTPLPGFGVRADLWDTNRTRLDLHGLFRVNKSASVWIGADSVFRRPVPIIGLQFGGQQAQQK